MEAKRFKSGSGANDEADEDDRRTRAAAAAAASRGTDSAAQTSEQDYVNSQVEAAVQAAARGRAMAMKGNGVAPGNSVEEPAAETPTTRMKETVTEGVERDEDGWLFFSVHRYHHLSMYKLDALPMCMDVDPGRDLLALGVSREFYPATQQQPKQPQEQTPETTDRGGGVGGSDKPQEGTTGSHEAPTQPGTPPTAVTYQLLIFRVPDKISAKKTETERDLSSNRDLKYLAGSDLGDKQPLRQVRFYDSDTILALQDYTLSCWTVSKASDFLVHTFSIHFDGVDGRLADFRISHNKLSFYLAFNDQCKVRKYRVYRETAPAPTASGEAAAATPSASTQATVTLIKLAQETEWKKSISYFKEGNLVDLHDLWFWNTLFDNSHIRPEVFIDGDPVDFEMGRQMLGPEWAANNDPRNNPKITWYYTTGKGLFGATARLSDKPEAKMLAFRSQTSTKWEVWTATLGFTYPDGLGQEEGSRLEINVHPDLEDDELFRVAIVIGDHVYNYQVTPDNGIVEVFRHDSHSGTVVRTATYPQNPEVVFSCDELMNVHVWWPDPKQLVFRQLPTIDFFNSSTGGAAGGGEVVEYTAAAPAVVAPAAAAAALEAVDQPLDLHQSS